ncbi:hypothetical protein F4553_007891 [Allocatelliglobosispora scoriae]|uniref:Uncharacterized protein n=1 Tax=Allocatelliglobosispora scoriae TaxID=643052 RepID=A0A841BZ81_9ACTN|nr:hypothetical protein [Allocatelliglobosispora scoriae]MBB5874457.1 hypothetical protein [Allocatelliglobosispora scoriae]
MKVRHLLAAAALGVAAVAAPIATTAASAYNPGSPCIITVTTGLGAVQYPGTVSGNGLECVPNVPLEGVLASLNGGVTCGATITLLGIEVRSVCF